MKRRAVVAGSFYPRDPYELTQAIESAFLSPLGPRELPSRPASKQMKKHNIIVPHAGYFYSAHYAAHSYLSAVKQGTPETVVILGPNHYGMGASIAIDASTEWQTPLGTLTIARDLRKQIIELNPEIRVDHLAHQEEHSLEVQVPFLQYIYGNSWKLLPISIRTHHFEDLEKLGKTLREALEDQSVLLVMSTDFNHFESDQISRQKDQHAIDAILEFNPRKLLKTVIEHDISMCGVAPVVAGMVYALGVHSPEEAIKKGYQPKLLAYGNSGDVNHDKSRVVGYGAFEIPFVP